MLAADGTVRLDGARGHGLTVARARRAIPVDWLAPEVDAACGALHARVRAFTDRFGSSFVAECRVILENGLAVLTARTVVLELQAARLTGTLHGATSEERYDDFCRRLEQRDRAAAVLREYPELARCIRLHVERWTEACAELAGRIDADREIITAVLDTTHTGTVARIADLGSDRHRGGRFVAGVTFECGGSVVYKPRPMAADVLFQDLLAWTARHGFEPFLRPVRCGDRGDHGWTEFVEHWSCTTIDEVERFFERHGGLLALMRVLQAADLHFDNVIAAGEHPVIVDLETLFHPGPPRGSATGAEIAAAELVARSVIRTGLLPAACFRDRDYATIDVSGLEGRAGQRLPFSSTMLVDAGTDRMRFERVDAVVTGGRNRPRLAMNPVRAFEYADRIVGGFTRMYELLLRERGSLLARGGPLDRFADVPTRVVLRPTRVYGRCLDGCTHPDALKDAASQERVLARLPLLPYRSADALRRAERRDLAAGDVPLFSTRPSSRDLWTSDATCIPDVLDESPVETARRVLRGMGDADYDRQISLIGSALATIAPAQRVAAVPLPPVRSQEIASLEQHCLEAAGRVGQRLVELSVRAGDEATWIGLSASGGGRLVSGPLGSDLYSGLPGIALFLAELGRISGVLKYDTLARAAAQLLCRRIDRESSWRATGAFGGWGGVAYVLARLCRLWGWRVTRSALQKVIARIDTYADEEPSCDIVSGRAGCVLALLAAEKAVADTGAGSLAARCGSGLLSRMGSREEDGWHVPGPTPPLTGFAHGAAGVACALDRLAAYTGDAAYTRAADAAVAYERALFDPVTENWPDLRDGAGGHRGSNLVAWCHGAVGVGLGRLASGRTLTEEAAREEISAAVRATLLGGLGADHSLCHGDFGSLELLSHAASAGLVDRATVEAAGRGVLNRLDADGWICGVPGGVETPGLMTGLAGIGYGLLQLAQRSRVPSVLMLDI